MLAHDTLVAPGDARGICVSRKNRPSCRCKARLPALFSEAGLEPASKCLPVRPIPPIGLNQLRRPAFANGDDLPTGVGKALVPNPIQIKSDFASLPVVGCVEGLLYPRRRETGTQFFGYTPDILPHAIALREMV